MNAGTQIVGYIGESRMSFQAERKSGVRQASGKLIPFGAEDQIETVTSYNVVCDGPKCAARNGKDAATVAEWSTTSQAANAPDLLRQWLTLVITPTTKPTEIWCCGPQCVKDFITYGYVSPPTSVVASPENINMPVEFPASVDKNEELLGELPDQPGLYRYGGDYKIVE